VFARRRRLVMTTKTRTGRKRRILQRLFIASLVLFFATYLTINVAARLVLEHYLTATLQYDISVGSVRLGLSRALVRDIVLRTTIQDGQPLVTIASVDAELTIVDGINHGIWANEVIVSDPQLHLTFSEDGVLMSRIPSLPAGCDGPLPLRSLKIVRGGIDVKQIGNEPIDVNNADLEAEFGSTIRVTAAVPDLFGGIGKFSGTVDAKSFAGNLQLSAERLCVSSADIKSLPLLSTGLESMKAGVAKGSVIASITIPANPRSPFDCPTSIECRVDSLVIPDCGVHAEDGRAVFKHDAGRLTLAANASVMGGQISVDGALQIDPVAGNTSQPDYGELKWTVEGVSLISIAEQLSMPGELAAVLNASGSVQASLRENRIHVSGSADSELSQIKVFGVRTEPLTVKAATIGTLSMVDGTPQPEDGHVVVSGVFQGMAVRDIIEQVMPRVGSMSVQQQKSIEDVLNRVSQWDVGGSVSASAEIKVPLRALNDVRLVEGSGRITGNRISACGYAAENMVVSCVVQNGSANVLLNGVQIVDVLTGKPTTVAGKCLLPFSPPGQVTAELQINNAPLSQAASLAGQPVNSVIGNASVSMSAEAPLPEISNSASWAGQGRVLSSLVIVNWSS
jgi:hypothetical protein